MTPDFFSASDDPIAAALRRDLESTYVPFDAARADAMIVTATAGDLLGARPYWAAPAAAAAAVLVLSGGVAYVATSDGSDGDGAPAGPPPGCGAASNAATVGPSRPQVAITPEVTISGSGNFTLSIPPSSSIVIRPNRTDSKGRAYPDPPSSAYPSAPSASSMSPSTSPSTSAPAASPTACAPAPTVAPSTSDSGDSATPGSSAPASGSTATPSRTRTTAPPSDSPSQSTSATAPSSTALLPTTSSSSRP